MLFEKIKNGLLPSVCLLCGITVQREVDLCMDCEEDLPWLKNHCVRCARCLFDENKLICGSCLKSPPPFNQMVSLFAYTQPIDRFILALKFYNRLSYAQLFGFLLAKKINEVYKHQPLPDLLVPMPLHPKRLKERGFNQVVEITKVLNQALKIKTTTVLQRVRNTKPQSFLSSSDRKKNVKRAFAINEKKIEGISVALLDDVVTTGHTVIEVSKTLAKAGVKKIDVWCCARTQSKD